MSERVNPNPYSVEDLLGDSFQRNERRSLGTFDSAHAVAFGTYEGQDVVAKPFHGKAALDKANKEAKLERFLASKDIRTVTPIAVVQPEQPKTAVLLSEYLPGLMGANTLQLEAEPLSPQGRILAAPLGSIALILGKVHSERVTHGDAQIKNFGFLAHETSEGNYSSPLVFDLESGGQHGDNDRGHDFLERTSRKDLKTLGMSLGVKVFGGEDHDTAADVFRDTIMRPYIEDSAASEVLNAQALSETLDVAQAEFMRGRIVTAAYNAGRIVLK